MIDGAVQRAKHEPRTEYYLAVADEAVPVFDRSWTSAAIAATCADEFLSVVARVIGATQIRSAGLVLAAFEDIPASGSKPNRRRRST